MYTPWISTLTHIILLNLHVHSWTLNSVICYNMQVYSLQGSWECDWCLRGFYFRGGCSAVLLRGRAFWQVVVIGSKTIDLDTNETRSIHFRWCLFLRQMHYVMNQLWRRLWEIIYELLVLFHDRGQSSQDECCGVEVRIIKSLLEPLMIFMSFQNVSSLFRCDCRGQEMRMHLAELNHVLNTVSMGGTLIVSKWYLVST